MNNLKYFFILTISILSINQYVYAADTPQESSNEYWTLNDTPPPESAPDIYPLYQSVINQMSLGYSFINYNFSGIGVGSAQATNLNVTKLFDMGVYIDLNYSTINKYHQYLTHHPSGSKELDLFGDYPMFQGLNAKVGYAFRVIPGTLYLIPYGHAGYNTNWATYTIFVNAPTNNNNLMQDYFITTGSGLKIDYRINKHVNTYYDFSVLYNKSQAPQFKYSNSLTNIGFNSTLGARFNVYKDFQLGINGFYQPIYYPNSPYLTPDVIAVTSSIAGMNLSFGLKY